jgi:exodeoxyribonuclease VII small subunit
MTDDTELGFEDALARLEERVRRLETGEVPLDEALSLFEEGVALARTCHGHLDEAERRVAALTRGSAGPEERPLAEPGD